MCSGRSKQRAQELSACDITQHYSLHAHQGRGATEIDLVEVMPGPPSKLPIVKNNLHRPYGSMTLQIAPGISNKRNRPPSGTLPEWGFEWYSNLTYGLNTSINPFFYGTYLAATKTDEPSKCRYPTLTGVVCYNVLTNDQHAASASIAASCSLRR